jgi:hypothetical protein
MSTGWSMPPARAGAVMLEPSGYPAHDAESGHDPIARGARIEEESAHGTDQKRTQAGKLDLYGARQRGEERRRFHRSAGIPRRNGDREPPDRWARIGSHCAPCASRTRPTNARRVIPTFSCDIAYSLSPAASRASSPSLRPRREAPRNAVAPSHLTPTACALRRAIPEPRRELQRIQPLNRAWRSAECSGAHPVP